MMLVGSACTRWQPRPRAQGRPSPARGRGRAPVHGRSQGPRQGGRRAPRWLLSCCRNAQKGVPDAEVHRVDWPWHVNVQRPLMHDVNALGSVGHTFPHVPLRARRAGAVRPAAGLTSWSY